MNYFFFAASLPMLTLGGEPPVTYESFRESCAANLCDRDKAALRALESGDEADTAHDFVTRWRRKETQLRNAAARKRADRLGADAERHLRRHEDFDMTIETGVSDAFNAPDPAERDLALDRLRWLLLDELAGTNSFSSNAVLAYSVRLRLVERWARMDREDGRKSADGIVNSEPGASRRPDTT